MQASTQGALKECKNEHEETVRLDQSSSDKPYLSDQNFPNNTSEPMKKKDWWKRIKIDMLVVPIFVLVLKVLE